MHEAVIPARTADSRPPHRSALTRASGAARSAWQYPRRAVVTVRADPLLRNGHALIFSSGATQLIGVAFWALATHHYSSAAVGRNSAAISAMAFLSGFAQLNLTSTLVRFLPVAGHRSRRLIFAVYASAASVAAVAAVVFVVLIPRLEPGLGFLRAGDWLTAWFVIAIMSATIFSLQDSALTGVHAAPAVPVENAIFACLKLALVVLLAGVMPDRGIFIAWTAAMVVAIGPTNAYVLRRALPRHLRSAKATQPVPSVAEVTRYLVPDFAASLFFMASTSLMPLVVLVRLGASANGHFALAWLIGYALYSVSFNIGSSLVVETAADPSAIRGGSIRAIVHISKLLLPAVVMVVMAAPWLLSAFGQGYSSAATGVLRLLAISALPCAITNIAIFSARSQRRMRTVIGVQMAICAGVFGIGTTLMGPLGLTGVGVGWLVAQTCVAIILIVFPRLWLPARSAGGSHADALIPEGLR